MAEVTDEMKVAVKKALEGIAVLSWREIGDLLTAAENARKAPVAPDGWQLVPKTPTFSMVNKGNSAAMNIQGGYDGPSRWEAMLAAAPTPPQQDDLRKAVIEECAKLIEDHIVMNTHEGKELRPRQNGNQDGLAYAAALRALAGGE